MAKQYLWKTLGLGLFAASALAYAPSASAKTLGFVLTKWHYAGQFTPDAKLECPQGFAPGLRDNFRAVFKTKEEQEAQITKYAGIEMRARGPNGESETYSPELIEDPLPHPEGQGKISRGFNLDGTKDGAATNKSCSHAKFSSPDDGGQKDIDNQLYRSMACIKGMRPDGVSDGLANSELIGKLINRLLIEVTGVDDEANDDHVEVTIAHGLDKVVQDASGNFIPGLTQRMDEKAAAYIFHVNGKIVNHVLITDPMPNLEIGQMPGPVEMGIRAFKDARLQIKIGPDRTTAVVGGYHDVERFYRFWAKTVGQHSVIANASAPSFWRSIQRMADGYKDPTTGKCTAISAAYDLELVRAFIVREKVKDNKISENAPAGQSADTKVALVDKAQ